MNSLRHRRWGAAAIVSAAAFVLSSLTPGGTLPANAAANESAWDPGYIISDAKFYDGNAMAVSDVQWFLANQEQRCVAGYSCLKYFASPTASRAADAMCAAYPGSPNESAASIITKVGRACGISQHVLLVLLQKEQSLVTSNAPSTAALDRATGFACPDTSACDANYFGFYNQVYMAARQFKRYANPPGTSNFFTWYPVGKSTAVRFSPNAACGSYPVTIRNRATAALYYYTPYQPNQAAMANLYGTGDSCSSYGNRNFWRMYTDWFGSPNGTEVAFVKAVYQDVLGRDADDPGLAYWVGALKQGYSRGAIAGSLISSTEYRSKAIDAVYQEVLGRPADAGGKAFWTTELESGRTRTDIIIYNFLASEEYFNGLGRSNAAFVTAMYNKILGHPPAQDAIDYYSSGIVTAGRAAVIDALYRSPESVRLRMNVLYQKYLGRIITDGDTNFWLTTVQASGDPVMIKGLLISAEYDARAVARFPLA